jgi:hypothetical protein
MKQHRKYSLLFYHTKNKKENFSTFLSFLKVRESESTTPDPHPSKGFIYKNFSSNTFDQMSFDKINSANDITTKCSILNLLCYESIFRMVGLIKKNVEDCMKKQSCVQ